MSIKTEMIRAQVRCPPPPGRSARSGALVLDIHDVEVSTGPAERKNTRFAPHDTVPLTSTVEAETLLSVGCKRIVAACSFVEESKATALLSVGSLASGNTEDAELPLLLPRITLSKSTPSRSSASTTALVVQIPSVHAHVSKPLLDGLQYLTDDVAQLLERVTGSQNGSDPEKADSLDSSLIGSRFFAKSRSGSTSSGLTAGRNTGNASKSESVIKVEITEGRSNPLSVFCH